jgi:hypothetical protein
MKVQAGAFAQSAARPSFEVASVRQGRHADQLARLTPGRTPLRRALAENASCEPIRRTGILMWPFRNNQLQLAHARGYKQQCGEENEYRDRTALAI